MRLYGITVEELNEALAAVEYLGPGHGPGREVVLGTTATGRQFKMVLAEDRAFLVSIYPA